MKVFIFINAPFPEGMASTKRVLCYAKGLKAVGVDVEVDVIHSFFSKEEDCRFPVKGDFEGVTYNYICGKLYPRSVLKRKLKKVDDMLKLYSYAIEHVNSGDVIYCNFRRIESAYMLMMAAKKTGAKIVQELCEIPYINMKFKSRFKRWYYQTIQMRHFDGIVPISHSLDAYIHQHSPKMKTIIVPILVEDDKQVKIGENPYKMPYIVHTGTMVENKDGISCILKAFAKVKESDVTGCKLVFAGPQSTESCSYIPQMKELGIRDDVILLGMIKDSKKLISLQQNASMSIVYRYDNMQARYGFSTKMGEVLITGKPLITTPIGGHKDYLIDKENALIVEPGNIQQLADTINYVLRNPQESKIIGDKGRELALNEFSAYKHGTRLKDFFETL